MAFTGVRADVLKNTDTELPKGDAQVVQEAIDALKKGNRKPLDNLSPAQQALLVKMTADVGLQANADAAAAAATAPGNAAAAQAVVDRAAGVPNNTYAPGSQSSTNYRPLSGTTLAQLGAAGYTTGVDVANTAGVVKEPEVKRLYEPGKGYGVLKTRQPVSVYEGEYGQKVNDDNFRDWMTRRLVVVGGVTPKGVDLVSGGNNLWKTAGNMVAANPSLRASMTPEQWLDLQYNLNGGDAAYQSALDEENAKANPITHTRQVSSYTVNAAEAQAAINDMSEALLGRMASNAELKKARGAMQKLLTPTVTNTTTNATDPSNVQVSSSTKAGVSPQDAQKLLEMRMKRGSEGMAMNVGQMFEQAMARM